MRTHAPSDRRSPVSRYAADYPRALSSSMASVDDLAEWEGTLWLTGLATFCAAVGTFVGVYAVIGLIGYAHRGFGAYWPMALILIIDVAVNVAVQVARFRVRRAKGLTKAQRRRMVRERQAWVNRSSGGG